MVSSQTHKKTKKTTILSLRCEKFPHTRKKTTRLSRRWKKIHYIHQREQDNHRNEKCSVTFIRHYQVITLMKRFHKLKRQSKHDADERCSNTHTVIYMEDNHTTTLIMDASDHKSRHTHKGRSTHHAHDKRLTYNVCSGPLLSWIAAMGFKHQQVDEFQLDTVYS